MSDSPPVLYQVDGAVATITLNRPDVLNALNTPLMLALREALTQAQTDEAVRAVIVTGAGRGFSAGADLASSSPGGGSDPGSTLRDRYHPVITLMRSMPKPIISAVNGVAAGAGMSIAMAGDIILAGRSASFLQAFSKIGLVPDAGSTWFLPRYVGDVRARAMAILADRISAEDAKSFGLVWQVCEDDALQTQAREMAAKLASMPTRAYAMIKEALNDSHQRDLPAQLELEAELQMKAAKTEDFREGVAAFLQKRPAVFTGK